jgi:chemotaxis protein CheC
VVSAVEESGMAEASELLGPGDTLVASCAMGLSGVLNGQLLLVFEDRAGLATADMLLRQPIGTATTWGEMEQSAVLETMNIVGCAYVNVLAAHLPGAVGAEIVPSPPSFRHEFAASLLEFALMDQAIESDRLLLIRTEFTSAETKLDWSLLFVPGAGALRALAAALDGR